MAMGNDVAHGIEGATEIRPNVDERVLTVSLRDACCAVSCVAALRVVGSYAQRFALGVAFASSAHY